MIVYLKQKVTFSKKEYGPGEVDIDVSRLSSVEQKYFHKLIQAGLASEAKKKPIDLEPESEKQKRLADRLLQETRKPRGPFATPQSLPTDVSPKEAAPESSPVASDAPASEGESLGESGEAKESSEESFKEVEGDSAVDQDAKHSHKSKHDKHHHKHGKGAR